MAAADEEAPGDTWARDLTAAIGVAVRGHRKRHRLSVQNLADRCASFGYPLGRPSLSNLENGRRGTITVQELHVIAKALQVPPARLLLETTHVELVPGERSSPAQAFLWLLGEPGATLPPVQDDRAVGIETNVRKALVRLRQVLTMLEAATDDE